MHFISGKHMERRTFVRGMGASIALPFLDAMVPAGRLSAAKAHQRVAESHAATVLGVERELQDVEAAVDRLGDELSAWRSVTIPFGPTAVVHGILDGLPASATVERGSPPTPASRRPWRFWRRRVNWTARSRS